MAQLFPLVSDDTRKHGRLASHAVAAEPHEISATMVTELFEMIGWDTVFLAADAPRGSIIETLVRHDTKIPAIMAKLGLNSGDEARLIQAVRASPGWEGIDIMLWAGAFSTKTSLWRRPDADGWAADPGQALAVAKSWGS